ncbi:PilZ domain-containing protein [Paraliomyxa miuraensis]|uniref:PilZ domain-containing protein n=1 Tax=Paraliomyxa miuraensis TaxID=376150 RepID=UPI00224F823E|nr:PilZ domain-containing protein [Paraliomyxa miuraensis]MCX4248026.1 PilZ domain-containing protein [Paraliomyxa miuraensis]
MRVVNDRRSSKRVAVRGEARLQTPEGPVHCRCVDISAGGMSVISPRAARLRQRARIESHFGGQNLVFQAVVVRRHKSREGYTLGLQFEGLDPFSRAQLDALLRSMQVQATLAQQAAAFVDRLPQMELPAEGQTSETLVVERIEPVEPPPPEHVEPPPPQDVPEPVDPIEQALAIENVDPSRLVDPVTWLEQHGRPPSTAAWTDHTPEPVSPATRPRPSPGPAAPPSAPSFSGPADAGWDATMLAPASQAPWRPSAGAPAGVLAGPPARARANPSTPARPSEPEPALLELSIDLTLEPPRQHVMLPIEPIDEAAPDQMRKREEAKTLPHPAALPPVIDPDLDLGDG